MCPLTAKVIYCPFAAAVINISPVAQAILYMVKVMSAFYKRQKGVTPPDTFRTILSDWEHGTAIAHCAEGRKVHPYPPPLYDERNKVMRISLLLVCVQAVTGSKVKMCVFFFTLYITCINVRKLPAICTVPQPLNTCLLSPIQHGPWLQYCCSLPGLTGGIGRSHRLCEEGAGCLAEPFFVWLTALVRNCQKGGTGLLCAISWHKPGKYNFVKNQWLVLQSHKICFENRHRIILPLKKISSQMAGLLPKEQLFLV